MPVRGGGGKDGLSRSSGDRRTQNGTRSPRARCSLRMWGGGASRPARSRGSSSRARATESPRPFVLLWLPEAYHVLVAGLLGGDAANQHCLERCVEAMLEQTVTSEPSEPSRREEMSLRGGLHTMHFQQCHITLMGAIAPARLRQLLLLVRAAADLVDDAVWEVNEGAMIALPSYCDQCDTFGHVGAVCPRYHGQERTEACYAPSAVHAYGHYTVRREGLNRSLERVINENGRSWTVKEATGDDSNCLIDTLRQMLQSRRHSLVPGVFGAGAA